MPEVNNIPPSLSYRPADPAEPVLDISIGDALRAATSTWRTRTALIDGTSEEQTRRRWTFEELLTETEKVARALLLRFVSGEHVAIWAANGPQWVMIELGAALAGLTLVTVNPAYLGEELAFVLRQSRARGIIVQMSTGTGILCRQSMLPVTRFPISARSSPCPHGPSS